MDHTQQESPQTIAIDEERVSKTGSRFFPKQRLWLHAVLFGATVFTTLLAGALPQGVNPFADPWGLLQGVPFSFTLMGILLTHEMGHYITSRRHGVSATLPYFIPVPPPFIIGTLGAFIRLRSPIMDKRALLDIGASGPIAGFVVSIVAVAIGLRYSEVVESGNLGGIGLGEPLIFQLISYLVIGPINEGYDVFLHPMAFAGWIGLFVTALNLIPIGQLDGGHVVYSILGHRHRFVSMAMIPILILMGFFGWPGWFVWALLPLVFGAHHPPIMNPEERLDGPRKVVGWATLIIFLVSFTPVPLYFPHI